MSCCLIQSIQPTLTFSYLKTKSLPGRNSSINKPNRAAPSPHSITASNTPPTEKKPRKRTQDEDDYHATLKALNSKGRFPRKSLGQHYMLNGSINDELVAAANVKEGDVVLEIGPGTGSLTNVLVNAGANVLAIEKKEAVSRPGSCDQSYPVEEVLALQRMTISC